MRFIVTRAKREFAQRILYRVSGISLLSASPSKLPALRFALAVAAVLGGASTPAQAQVATNAFADYEKRIRSAEMVSPLKTDLFGDNVSLFNGSTEFSAIDVDVPGNNALPVRLGRRFKVEVKTNGTLSGGGFSADIEPLGGFGVWDIDVPYIYGMFDAAYGWSTGSTGQGSTQRCSGPVIPRVTDPFDVKDAWSGYRLRVPGAGDQEISLLGSANPRPSDGHTYRWGTREMYRGRCIPSTRNYPGEGFVFVDPQGTSYTFDHAIVRHGGVIEKQNLAMGRAQVFFMATRVQDRHGNYVDYKYSGDRLERIEASDGRLIQIIWSGNSIARVVAHGREWKYYYGSTMTVELPDRSKWVYEPIGALHVTPAPPLDDGGACSESLPATASPFSMVVTHPSGARGRFDFSYLRHGRSGTPSSACTVDYIDEQGTVHRSLKLPDYLYTYSLVTKTISGPGLATQRWEYGWEDPTTGRVDLDPSLPYCGYCDEDKVAYVYEPDGVTKEYVFGALWYYNEGRLLAVRTRDSTGSLVKSEVYDYVSEEEVKNEVPFPARHGELTGSDDISVLYNRPQKRVVISQDGASFHSEVLGYDAFARPLSVRKYSSLGHTKTEATEYHDNLVSWTLGQVKKQSVVDRDVVVSQTDYYPDTALPYRVFGPGTPSVQGVLLQELAYDMAASAASGQRATLRIVKDGRGSVTSLSDWKRGIPQLIQHSDGTDQRAVVDDDGTIASVTDENGSLTCYGYDAVGRLARITHPSEAGAGICSENDWNETRIRFEPIAGDEYGIPAGHWRRTEQTGNATKIAYFDGFWRPIVEEAFDAADKPATWRWVANKYDHEGRQTFASYPVNPAEVGAVSWAGANRGSHTTFDALGRARTAKQDSEHGLLTTDIEYGAGFTRTTRNPRGQVTVERFQAYDQPVHDWPVQIDAPEKTRTVIERDVFGKPLKMTRQAAP